MKNLLSVNDLNSGLIENLLNRAEELRKEVIIPNKSLSTLRDVLITHLFFEPSTRTQYSFSVAGMRLGALVLNPHMGSSSTVKGESLLDTVSSFIAMGSQIIVIRHSESGVPAWIANEIKQQACIINGGDGTNEHPSQALLDLLTIKQNKADFASLKIAIIGDILHSRVAHSLIAILQIMGCREIRLIGPQQLMPQEILSKNVVTIDSVREGIDGVDVIVTLRIQRERMEKQDVPNAQDFFSHYGLTSKLLTLAPNAIVLHPGPINRGIEIESAVADGPQSRILQQIQNGVAVRMAIIEKLLL